MISSKFKTLKMLFVNQSSIPYVNFVKYSNPNCFIIILFQITHAVEYGIYLGNEWVQSTNNKISIASKIRFSFITSTSGEDGTGIIGKPIFSIYIKQLMKGSIIGGTKHVHDVSRIYVPSFSPSSSIDSYTERLYISLS